jgi:hypothetical protein
VKDWRWGFWGFSTDHVGIFFVRIFGRTLGGDFGGGLSAGHRRVRLARNHILVCANLNSVGRRLQSVLQ